ncbi:toll/interleukin-1 receptor domain-containing protein [Fibrella sp. HMF5036]|uniref:Toll/interleukin-1 receptor domain-containing protein n=1 Tax=Fibrella aquatilis TaxID=2817059 RepID=A0A939G536_9BACT|nr:toll/interleukin-1 receptor domain-containing protein [Fibrella aquatilis]
MNKLFISYRRVDSEDATGRIYDRLEERYGEDNVFKDFNSIPVSVDFREYVKTSILGSRVTLVVIGRGGSTRPTNRATAASTTRQISYGSRLKRPSMRLTWPSFQCWWGAPLCPPLMPCHPRCKNWHTSMRRRYVPIPILPTTYRNS